MKLKHYLFAVLATFLTLNLSAVEVNRRFLNAIHQVESSGRTGAIIGDGGRALGPLQIHREYFHDAAEYDPSLGNNYRNCIDLAFSQRVVTAYLNRYASRAVASNDYATLARIHNGGPAGHRRTATVQYWNRVRAHM